uniref:Rab11 family-interacting protein 1-like n=1 Tax=Myripristis murdjan TaxID=586833 RepID=A0A667ZU02_9TELE
MSSPNAEEDQRWMPTHVQVTVLRCRGLRGKGKHGTSDVYTIIQLGKEKYSTCVVEKTTSPEWKEECSFELLPGVLEDGRGNAYSAGSSSLVLTVMHRALIGLDVFLGQALIPLDKAYQDNICIKNEWYRLNSKTGKKEKERGEIQVTIQFTRNNLTASMYDLAVKDKTYSTFSKLKERMKGKKRASDEDSSSAILPGGYGALYRMRNRLPSDGGGEEEYEDDEGGELRRSKMRNFFLRGKLRKSSDTRSSTSLGSESSESSSRGGSLSPTAGISVVVSDLSNSPSNSSNLTADNSPGLEVGCALKGRTIGPVVLDKINQSQKEHTANTSPKSSFCKSEPGDEAGEITIAVPQPSVCINGSHAYNVQPLDPGSGKPAGLLGLGLLQKSLPLSMSLQNLSPRAEELPKGPAGDGRRWSFDKAGEEEKAAIAAVLEQSGPMLGDGVERLGQAAASRASSSASESESQGKKQRRNLFSHGRSESAGKGHSQSKDESEQAPAPAEEKHRGWFGSKDSHSKPRWQCVSWEQPFFSYSSRPPISQLFPQASNPNPTPPRDRLAAGDPVNNADPNSKVEAKLKQRPLPPIPTEGDKLLSKKSSNPFMSAGAVEPDVEWDDSFEAFAAGRLQSPEEPTSDCRPQQNSPNVHPLERCNNKVLLPTTDDNKNTNVADAPHPPALDVTLNARTEPLLEPNELSNQPSHSHKENLATFTQFLDTITETNSETLNTSANPPDSDVCTGTNQPNNATNTNTNVHQVPCDSSSHTQDAPVLCPNLKPNSNSPNSGSSGVGSSAEEDFLSSLSVYSASEKFSASSSEDAEAQQVESSNLSFDEKSSVPAVVKSVNPLEFENNIDGSDDLSLVDVAQGNVQHRDDDEKVHLNSSQGQEQLLIPQPEVPPQLPVISTKEMETEDIDIQTPSLDDIMFSDPQPDPSISSQSDNEKPEKGSCDLKGPLIDFSSEEINNSIVSVTNNVEVMNPTSLDEQPSTHPSFYVMTSSPGDSQCILDSLDNTILERQDASQDFLKPVSLFSEFLSAGTSQGFDDNLLHTGMSDQSTSSVPHSQYVSADSQHYVTCLSYQLSKFFSASEEAAAKQQAEETPSASSSLCGTGTCDEVHEVQPPVSGLEDSTKACRSPEEGKTQIEGLGLLESEEICLSEDRTAPLEPSFTLGDDFELQMPPSAPTDTSCGPGKLSEGSGGNQHVVLDDFFPKRFQTQSAMLQRSQSEGTMRTSFEELLVPSFGSDPSVMQECSSAKPGPGLPFHISSAPSLTAESSSPLVLCPLPTVADAWARSPWHHSTAQANAPALGNAKPMTDAAAHAVLPQETQQQQAANQQTSPHPVKPLTTAILAEEKRAEGRSVLASGLEKLKSTIHPGRSSQQTEQEADRKKSLTEGAGSYYHLTHSELVALLVQREAELDRQKEEFRRQAALLSKREVELKKLKPQVRDLEDYIDTLLVRIMEQTPTLLQVRSKYK